MYSVPQLKQMRGFYPQIEDTVFAKDCYNRQVGLARFTQIHGFRYALSTCAPDMEYVSDELDAWAHAHCVEKVNEEFHTIEKDAQADWEDFFTKVEGPEPPESLVVHRFRQPMKPLDIATGGI